MEKLHDWHVTAYMLAVHGRIDTTRIREVDGRLVMDNDPEKEALCKSLDDEQRVAVERMKAQLSNIYQERCEWVDAELQAALSPPPPPRAEPATPIADVAPAQNTAAPVAAGASDDAEQGLTTNEIAYAFYDVNGWPVERWIKNLSAAKWATPALIGLGEQGGAPSVWRPLTLAQLIHARAKGNIEKKRTLELLRARFNRQDALAPWRDDFNEFFATFSDAD